MLAAANIAADVLVWLWPDVGLLLLAWVVATAVAVTGLRLVWRALRPAPRRREPQHRARRPALRRAGRVTGAVLAAAVAVAASLGSAWVFARVAPIDDFYTWTSPVPTQPGELLRVAARTRCRSMRFRASRA